MSDKVPVVIGQCVSRDLCNDENAVNASPTETRTTDMTKSDITVKSSVDISYLPYIF